MTPAPQEQQEIRERVAQFESATGIQAVAAVTDRADVYPDIPWKAYAIGSALGAVVAVFDPFPVSGWSHASVIALDAMLMLASGAVLAALAAFVPAFGRLFLDRVRAEAEALQYAQSMFLERELFRTQDRRAVLVVMCRFERVAVIVVDTGLAQFAPSTRLTEIRARAGRAFRNAGLAAGFKTAFDELRALLESGGFTASATALNEIADDLLVDRRG